MATITRGQLTFEVTESGPVDGEPVLLLHGFPQHADSWHCLVPLLTERGFRTLAMSQRGYSAGARPEGRCAYRVPELVADVVAVIDAYGGGPVHLVGHDWGANVAWAVAADHPEKLASLTALSVPHPRAMRRAMLTSRQGLHSWYMFAFQLPWLPERVLHAGWDLFLTRFGGQSVEQARRDRAGFATACDLTAPINWYRALPVTDPRTLAGRVVTPTLMVWSDRDLFIARRSVELCQGYVDGPLRFVTMTGVSHWIPDEAPRELAELMLPHLEQWSVAGAQGVAAR
jgi:pimeloyl-ACP methyl ester carboxylesterase